MNSIKRILLLILSSLIILIFSSCTSTKSVKYTKRTLPARSNIAVIIDTPQNLKNVVLVKFLSKNYTVKAFNASDLYSMDEIFDIADMKKVSYNSDVNSSILSMEKTYNNIYKLHLYNFEINKAEILQEIRNKWGVQYLIVLDLKNWEEVSWGRIIDLNNYEIIWLENYPSQYSDNIETIIDHFIASMTGK